ncbi:MAG: penicillin-binding protein 1A [Burkholderiaceae bacterium]|nr:MAG: penicillin-binding protein 1A [Burkholderiaceae bacterium]
MLSRYFEKTKALFAQLFALRERGWSGWLFLAVMIFVAGLVCLSLLGSLALALAYPNLPSLESLTDYRPKIPLRIYSVEGVLLGEFGEERRNLVHFKDVPPVMVQAVLAAEDDRFFEHGGVDLWGVARAAVANLSSGHRGQGASTITMQVARNFFLSSERSFTRKVYEALLAFKIEANLSKNQILEIYLNQIYLGQRAYGFASAAQIYFGKPLAKITAAEAAMLAGLPKAPSAYNPVVNPKRAKIRQQYILERMASLGFLNKQQYQAALAEPLQVKASGQEFEVHAEYATEMVRQLIYNTYHEDAYSRGLNVYTTLRKVDQDTAYKAVRSNVMNYVSRHGYDGPEGYLDLSENENIEDAIDDALLEYPDSDDIYAAVVLEASPKLVKVARHRGEAIEIKGTGLTFAASALNPREQPNKRIRRGAVVRIMQDEKGVWGITRMPEVEAGFVAADTHDGGVRALVGGFDFNRNKFNHVSQSWRQPGSSFKPFIYSAALEKGFTPSTIINDAPIRFEASVTGSEAWEPKNYDGKYEGPMKLRQALAKSKNMVSIRILRAIGPQYAQDYATRFGFEAAKHPPYLTLALGAGSTNPWQMVAAYSVFANGGYLINPYLISKVTDADGKVLAEAKPQTVGADARQVIDPRNAYIMDSLLRDVTRYGTAAKAVALKRNDIAGKTGTTNDSQDAWFAGYQPNLVGVAWIGYDIPKKLGDKETGGGLALPIWMKYMEVVLKGVPEVERTAPDGVVSLNGEYYYTEYQPGQSVPSLGVEETPEPPAELPPGQQPVPIHSLPPDPAAQKP